MVVLFLALASLLLAADVVGQPSVPSHGPRGKRGVRAPVHRSVPSNNLVSRDTGAVQHIWNGGGWILPVLIGGQQVFFNVDTGSSDL